MLQGGQKSLQAFKLIDFTIEMNQTETCILKVDEVAVEGTDAAINKTGNLLKGTVDIGGQTQNKLGQTCSNLSSSGHNKDYLSINETKDTG